METLERRQESVKWKKIWIFVLFAILGVLPLIFRMVFETSSGGSTWGQGYSSPYLFVVFLFVVQLMDATAEVNRLELLYALWCSEREAAGKAPETKLTEIVPVPIC